jgi:hypothetical protein
VNKKSKTTENSTTNTLTTSTPTVAPWLSNNYQQLGQQIADFGKTDPSSYVAGPSQLQTQAFSQAGNLGGWQSLFDQAGTAATAAGNAPANTAGVSTYGGTSILDNGGIEKFMNAGLNDLVGATLADYDYGAGRQTAAAKAAATANKAFNSDRSVFKEAELADALTRGRATTSGQLRYDAFDKAATLAAQEAQMRQQAALASMGAMNQGAMFNAGQQDNAAARKLQSAGLLGSLGEAQGSSQRADIGLLGDLGGQQQAITQSQLNATPTFLQLLGALNGQIPIGAFTSQTNQGTGTSNSTSVTKSSDPLGSLAGILGAAGSLTSGLGALGFGVK